MFFEVLAVSCRICRSSRKKPAGCSLAPLRTLSIPSPCQVLVFARFAGSARMCFSMFLVGEIYFPGWESGFLMLVVCVLFSPSSMCVSLYVGKGEVKSSGEIRGQRPHGATPLPTPCGASAIPYKLPICIKRFSLSAIGTKCLNRMMPLLGDAHAVCLESLNIGSVFNTLQMRLIKMPYISLIPSLE